MILDGGKIYMKSSRRIAGMRLGVLSVMFVLALFGARVHAAVYTLPDHTLSTGGANVYEEKLIGTTISNETNLYITGTMTWDAFTSGGAWAPNANSDNSSPVQWGSGWNDDTFVWQKPGTETALDTITQGTPLTVVIKVNQNTGAFSVYYNPDLGALEDGQTPDVTGTSSDFASIDRWYYRSKSSDTISFTDFAFYTEGDSPFDPPPAGTVIIIQ
jgi:hypothetical protein